MNDITIIKMHPVFDTEEGAGLLPATGHEDDAGIDCYALEDIELPAFDPAKLRKEKISVSVPVHLGFGVKMPKRTLLDVLTRKYWHAEITSRSSQNKQGVLVLRGIIDQPYEGELIACLANLNPYPVKYAKGERICQLLFFKSRKVQSKDIRVLKKTKRGAGGFGSTGK